MNQSICNASYKKKNGQNNETLNCTRKAKYTSTNGSPCCGYHKNGVFLVKDPLFTPFDCSICFDTCHSKEEQYETTCKHSFHTKCMKKWAAKVKTLSCPLCRTNITNHPFKCMTHTIGFTIGWQVADSFHRIAAEYQLSYTQRRGLRERMIAILSNPQNPLNPQNPIYQLANSYERILETILEANTQSNDTLITDEALAAVALLRIIHNNILTR